jgi:hypothetical protein
MMASQPGSREGERGAVSWGPLGGKGELGVGGNEELGVEGEDDWYIQNISKNRVGPQQTST